jgi:hypothetical protein
MTDTVLTTDEQSVRFVQEHGGRLYVWTSEAGIEHVTAEPQPGIDFNHIPGDGFDLYVEASIEAAHTWRLVYHRFPRPHVRALWNGTAFDETAPLAPRWEAGRPWDAQS